MITARLKLIVNLLDARLVAHRRTRVRLAARGLSRIGAAFAMRLVKNLGFVVVGLVVLVFQRPLGRDTILVPDLFEVALAQSEKSGPVDLRVTADPIGSLRVQWFAFAILPDFVRMIAVLDKDRFGIPVLLLLRQEGTALQD